MSLARRIASSKSRVAEHRQDRAEDLLAHQPRVLAGLGHHGGLEEPALVMAAGAAAGEHLAALGDAVLDLLEQLVAAAARVHRAHPQPWLLGLDGAVAGLVALDAVDQLRDEVVVDGVVHEHALAAQAGLAGVPVAADDDGLDRRVDVGVLAHDHRVRAAELERDALHLRACDRDHVPADLGGAGEGDPAHVGMADERVADVRAAARDDVEHAVGHAGLGEDARDLERRQRRRGRRLGHDGVAARQRRRDLRPQQREREVVGGDRGAHADRPPDHLAVGGAERRGQILVGAPDLGRGLRVVAHAVREVGDLAARLGDRLALLGGQHGGDAPSPAPRSASRRPRGCARASRCRSPPTPGTRAWRSRPPARRRRARRTGPRRRPPRSPG